MLSKKIGIDLGTSTVLVYVKGEGIVVNEPSPIREGAIGDFAVSEGMLREFIGRAHGRQRLFKPEIMVCVPAGVTSVERRAVTEAAISAGARQAWLIDKPMAAAIGADVPIAERTPHAICVIGGGTTEVAVISLSGMVVAHSVRVGGDRLDDAIAALIKRRHNLVIEERSAEELKIAVGSAIPLKETLRAEVRGRDAVTELERSIEVSSGDVTEAVQAPLRLIAAAVRKVIDETPPELAADIARGAIILAGGGALLRGLDVYLSTHAGIRAVVAKDPQTAVVRGAGLALEHFEVVKRNQSYLR